MEADIRRWLRGDGQIFLKEIGLKEGQHVLDFGCGEGHYTIPAAKVVGKEGRVYAVDKDKEVLDELMRTAKSEGLKNIVPIKTSGDLEIDLSDDSVDVALLYDVVHYMEVEERSAIYEGVCRILKADGLLSVYPKHHRLDEPLWTLSDVELEDIVGEIESANFHFERKFFRQLIHDDNYNRGYVLNFKKAKEGR